MRARFVIISHIFRVLLVVDLRLLSEERLVLFLFSHLFEVGNMPLYLRLDICQLPWQRDSGQLILSPISISIPCLRFVLWNDVACQRSLTSGLMSLTILVTVSPTFVLSPRPTVVALAHEVLIVMYLQRHIVAIVPLMLI